MDKRRILRFVLCLIAIVLIMLYIAPKATPHNPSSASFGKIAL